MELERKKIMSYDDRHRPLLVTNGGDDGGGSGGPTTLNGSGANEVGRRSTPHSPKKTIVFKSPGGDMAAAAALGFPFTAAQWKELERQAMIYKYMVASLPVPSDLLINFPDPTNLLGNGSLYSLRYPDKDVEPERCKRTDGKKWRCSRDVAPHKKYCERHVHRGRPRSRKPVEVHPSIDSTNYNNKKTRLNQTPSLQTNPTSQPINQSTINISSSFLGTAGQPKDPQNISKSFYKEPNRVNLGWMMDGEMVATNGVEQQWLDLMDNNKRGLSTDQRQSGYGTNDSIFHHGLGEQPLNLFSYPDNLPQEEDIFRSNNDLFLNSDPISLKLPPTPMEDYPISRGFIDAWSSGNLEVINNEPSISSPQGKLSPSSLNLSIAMAADSGHQEPKDCPISWVPFSSGGPLAEVLQPGYIANAGDSISPPATAVSSPSGVLQRAFFSQSDGSVCNSPTMALSATAAAPAQEVVAFQWFS